MQIVGVDFGTTNIRISTWDSEQNLPPEVKLIGNQGTTTMPAVVAFQKGDNGGIDVVVGEDADGLMDEENKTLVIRNIKRYALSSDNYVYWHLDVRNQQDKAKGKPLEWPQKEWRVDKDEPYFLVWGEEFPMWELIRRMLAEAFRRVGFVGGFDQWRAGCPVHADMAYREGLARVLLQVTGKADVNWIGEEPILFLTLARELGDLQEGSYLVYDLGGGSFDCTLVEVRADGMLVYGADGHPLLGGSDVDSGLVKKLGYTGQIDLLRQAKERLSLANPSEVLLDGTTITLSDTESVLRDEKFATKSITTTRDAYVSAKVFWKRKASSEGNDPLQMREAYRHSAGTGEQDGDTPDIGEVYDRNLTTGEVRFVWQLMWDDIARDVDQIILVGGPTRAEYFRRELAKRFGEEKITTATALLPTLIGTPDLELVGISMGACYSYNRADNPLYLNRIPARIKLQDLQTGAAVEYEPYQHLDYKGGRGDGNNGQRRVTRVSNLFASYVSEPLLQDKSDPHKYELTCAYPQGDTLFPDPKDEFRPARYPIDGFLESGDAGGTPRLPASSLSLVIDRYGRVGVVKHSSGPGLSWTKIDWLVEAPPWQTALQQKAAKMEDLIGQMKKSPKASLPRDFTPFLVHSHPWD